MIGVRPVVTTMSESTEGPAGTEERAADPSDDRRWIARLGDRQRHRLLSSDERRAALAALADLSEPVGLTELARAVAADRGAESGDADAVGSLEIALHHVHLPLMADFGLLEYDRHRRLSAGGIVGAGLTSS